VASGFRFIGKETDRRTSTGWGAIKTIFPGSSPRKVTTIHDQLARDFKLPKQERVEWKGADGVTVEGLLYYPIDYQPASRVDAWRNARVGVIPSRKIGNELLWLAERSVPP